MGFLVGFTSQLTADRDSIDELCHLIETGSLVCLLKIVQRSVENRFRFLNLVAKTVER